MNVFRAVILTLVLSAIAAGLGVWGGATYVSRAQRGPSLHQTLHNRLDLSADQQQRISALERQYAARHQALEAEMRAANVDLAQAYEEAHAYTPQMQTAIDRFHRAMDSLQKETMLHLVAMRAVLTPAQAAKFDQAVVKSLAADGRDRR